MDLLLLEESVKQRLSERGISRGKVDVYIGVERQGSEPLGLDIDEEYAAAYISALVAFCGISIL